jgi:hypothetical protein
MVCGSTANSYLIPLRLGSGVSLRQTITTMKAARYTMLVAVLACRPTTRQLDTAKVSAIADGPVVLRNGENPVDLLGNGTRARVFVGWRGNFNAHGFSAVGIYLRAKSDVSDSAEDWLIVPRFGGPYDGDVGRDLFTTSEGADCTLGDLRIVQHRGAPAELIVARRELGKSFADSAATHFDYYKLTKNSDGLVGWPLYYYAFSRTVDAHHQYCDVNLAFEKELHLGRRGLGHGEASQ